MRNASGLLLVLFALSAGLSFAPAAEAQILHVKQTVYGMDCAPCAYGLEKRLERIDGVSDARVSLNEGFAAVDLAEGGSAGLGTIREAIRESGFSAEEATIRAAGVLRQEGGRWLLELAGGERFELHGAEGGERAYRSLEPGRATITGRVAAGEAEAGGAYRLELVNR